MGTEDKKSKIEIEINPDMPDLYGILDRTKNMEQELKDAIKKSKKDSGEGGGFSGGFGSGSSGGSGGGY